MCSADVGDRTGLEHAIIGKRDGTLPDGDHIDALEVIANGQRLVIDDHHGFGGAIKNALNLHRLQRYRTRGSFGGGGTGRESPIQVAGGGRGRGRGGGRRAGSWRQMDCSPVGNFKKGHAQTPAATSNPATMSFHKDAWL